jgi:hypothetical protein
MEWRENVTRLAEAIMRRIFSPMDRTGDLARLPAAYRNAGGGGLLNGIAAAGLLRLAMRWPGLSVLAILVMVAARVIGRNRQPTVSAVRQTR